MSTKAMRYETNYNLKAHNTLRLESVAKKAYFPSSEDELIAVLKENPNATVIGGGSNIIFSSSGIEEPLIFTQNLNKITLENDTLFAQCGVKSPFLSQCAFKNSISGFEFLIGIPSCLGGNIFMNASAHNQSISDCLLSVYVYNRATGEVEQKNKECLNFEYRNSVFKKNNPQYAILYAIFEVRQKKQDKIKKTMEENLKKRKETQPTLKFPNAGSVFRNPKNESAGRLLDFCSLKGEMLGGARIYENHANFIINQGGATSKDILLLMSKMYDCVYNKFGIKLKSELIFIGNKTEAEEEIWKKITEK